MSTRPRPNHALVVDDHDANRLLARTLLRKLGWTSDEAASGPAALRMVAQIRYALILLDISMPEMSGEETCAAIRTMPDGSSLRIVAYTAHAFPDEKARIMTAGFDDLLIKPVNLQSLGAVLS